MRGRTVTIYADHRGMCYFDTKPAFLRARLGGHRPERAENILDGIGKVLKAGYQAVFIESEQDANGHMIYGPNNGRIYPVNRRSRHIFKKRLGI